MTSDTGRLRTPLAPALRRIVFEATGDDRPWQVELEQISLVDQAHVVMLVERRLVDQATGARLLDAIIRLRHQDFAPLRARPRPRGTYLAYEHYLIEQLGESTGGVLHTGRSRNDLNATCLKLRLRGRHERLASAVIVLIMVLLNRARRYQDSVLPAYTHFQAAVPISYGHYLLGVAAALVRDARALSQAGDGLDECPLGAGAVGGTTLPIDATRTAQLLGFTRPSLNSVDAVASRDGVLRLLGAATTLGVTLDRTALDLLMWSTAEFGLLTFPDRLVGSSSMMPQKRNPFLLEHVQGKSAAALGAFVAAASAMRGAPFTNSIAVGTEATSHVWPALDATTQATTLLRMAVAAARPNTENMLARARSGQTAATALAEQLVSSGVPFRKAHCEVGASLRETGLPGTAKLDVTAVRAAADYGSGPGPRSFAHGLNTLLVEWAGLRASLWERRWRHRQAEDQLAEAVAAVRRRRR